MDGVGDLHDATRVEDWPYPEDADFVARRDPDGNELCVIDHTDLA